MASELINLASERLGAVVLAANDDFFAGKENLVRDNAPIANDEYSDRGKWMDGWETRRRREPGYDWCTLRLGARGTIREVIVDTTHFKGNHPPECSIDAVDLPGVDQPPGDAKWRPLLPRSPLAADSPNHFAITDSSPATHLRLNIFPDGGVARLCALGEVIVDADRLRSLPEVDLAAVENGGGVVLASDMFFGHRHNLIMPGAPRGMHDGWETRRRRGPGHDWAIVRLGVPGTISRLEVDTTHFKGNAPGSCSIEGIAAQDVPPERLAASSGWPTILPEQRLRADTLHTFSKEIQQRGPFSHVRLNIFPDGGVSRLRVWGTAAGTPG